MEEQDVVFRGTKEGLYLVLKEGRDFDVLKEKIRECLQKAEYFFQGAEVVLDTGSLALTLDQILELQHLLAYPLGLKLKKIVHGDSANSTVKQEQVRREAQKVHRPVANRQDQPYERRANNRGFRQETATLLLKGTLRSGRGINYDGNVVVVGDVNPGAEIQATGDIIVMGSLRGLAHAGVDGNVNAVVVASKLQPTQLRIADIIGRPPEGSSFTAREPEIAKLKDGMIFVEPLEAMRREGEY